MNRLLLSLQTAIKALKASPTLSILAIGTGERAPQWLAAVLESRDRTLAGATAPAQGLYLVDVGYDARHGLPRPPAGPWFAC